jgi:hypothetical protein
MICLQFSPNWPPDHQGGACLRLGNSTGHAKFHRQVDRTRRILTGWRKATSAKGVAAVLAVALAGGCSPGGRDGWRGYYYDNVLASAPARVSGPYDSAPQCVAAMHDLLRKAPTTAGFSCARRCQAADDGSVANCREVAR